MKPGKEKMVIKINISNNYPHFQIQNSAATALVKHVLRDEGLAAPEISVILIDDEYLRKLHRDFLNDDTFTDVMTFNLGGEDDIEGEIYISVDRAKRYAMEFNVLPEEEIARLIIHGLLHLNGFDDQTVEEREKMREMEAFYLRKYAQNIRELTG